MQRSALRRAFSFFRQGAVPARAFASDIDAGAADSDAAAAAADLEYRPRNSTIWMADHQIQ